MAEVQKRAGVLSERDLDLIGGLGGRVAAWAETNPHTMKTLLDAARHQGQDEARAASVEGWKLVPVEPTKEMVQAFIDADKKRRRWTATAKRDWRAFLSAAPTQPAEQAPRDERIEALEVKASLFDAIMANVPAAYEKDGARVLTGSSSGRRLVSHLEAQDAVHVITVARDKYRAAIQAGGAT